MAVHCLSEPAVEITLETSRLELWLLSIEDMQSLVDDPHSVEVWQNKPYRNPHGIFVGDPGPIRWRLPQAVRDPSTHQWFIRLMVEKSSRVIVGSLSFHEPPDKNGMLEVGLGVAPAEQRNGYATEALIGLWSWATQFPEVQTFRYCVGLLNTPSISLIGSLGFTRVGQQLDDIDGPEEMYEMSVSEFRQRYLTN